MIEMSFLHYLATARSEAEFARTAAGFTALQIYDSVKTNGLSSFQMDALRKVERDVAIIDASPDVREGLQALIVALPFWESAGPIRVGRQAVYTSLLMYGQALGSDGEWKMAESVYALAGMDTELDGETWYAAESRLLMGRASRMCADWEGAQVAYRRAYELGMEAGDISIALRAQIGEATILWSRGNLQEAKQRLIKVGKRARQSCPSVVPRVTLALAAVANMAGEYEHAIDLAFSLLDTLADDDELKYQTLVDLASFLTDYGLPAVASTALRLVEKSAPEKHVRRHATLNLFFLAAHHDTAATFDALRAALVSERLTPRQQAQYALFTAQGCRRFGRLAEAKLAADDAIRLANQYQLFQLVFEAEAELREILLAPRSTTGVAQSHTQRFGANTLAVSDDVMPNPSSTSIAMDSVPPRIRHVAESLQTMAGRELEMTAAR